MTQTEIMTETEKMLEYIAAAAELADAIEAVITGDDTSPTRGVNALNAFRIKEAEIQIAVASLQRGVIKYQ